MTLEIDWKGLEIHPEFPPEGVLAETYLNRDRMALLWRNVKGLALESGLEMKMPARLSKSELSLLGGQFSKERGRLREYSLAIYQAYFFKGQNIASPQVLSESIEEAGMDPEEFTCALSEDRLRKTLKVYQKEAQEQFVTAVPTFFIGGKRLVGAQSYQLLKETVLSSNP